MKLYKIGLNGTDMFLKCVAFDTEKDKLKIIPVFAFCEKDEAIFEEDEAKFYIDELNKNENEVIFYMKEFESER